jgi:predicted glycoside hydrolase/deacetylase ChbG (UPF0249 family)
MATFFHDIIPPHTVKKMKGLGENVDVFGMTVRQILNFQMLLYDSLNDLAGRFASLRTEVSQMGTQLSNVGESVHTYLENNNIQVFTREGVSLDDALAGITDKIMNIYRRLETTDERTEELQAFAENSVSRDEAKAMAEESRQNTIIVNESAAAVHMLQQELKNQSDELDQRWGVIRAMFSAQVEQVRAELGEKPSFVDLEQFVRHTDLAVLCTLFSSISQYKRVQIKDVLPQVFMDSSLTMQDKLKLCFERLYIERDRVDTEQAELVKSFEELRQLVILQSEDRRTGVVTRNVEVRDVATDSGYSESSDTRPLTFTRGERARISISTLFKGPTVCECAQEPDLAETLEAAVVKGRAASAAVDVPAITHDVLQACQPMIEKQLASLAGAFGVQFDSGDIHTLVDQLGAIEAMKSDMAALKLKMKLKVDNSLLAHELQKYVKREQFFEMMEQGGGVKKTVARLPKVRSFKQEATSPAPVRPKPEVKTPVSLVPARNPKMLSVNDKYLIGDDGKTYLKESSRIADRDYREPPITGDRSGRVSYYDRSKMSMEIEGIEAVIDFQPFVPVESKGPSPREDGE